MQKNPNSKILLVNGEPGLRVIDGNSYYYYFDQWGGYSGRFGITKVPSVVYQQQNDDFLLTIEEVVAE